MIGLFSSHVGECLAVQEGAWFVLSRGFTKWIIETDAINVFKVVSSPAQYSIKTRSKIRGVDLLLHVAPHIAPPREDLMFDTNDHKRSDTAGIKWRVIATAASGAEVVEPEICSRPKLYGGRWLKLREVAMKAVIEALAGGKRGVEELPRSMRLHQI
ncbi:hypothetical protein TIFTF001_029554 [Ficus carica]|uniref:Uncharacterized protein n=1 Tax=Ficus carica TaxID=3494 RepID=A0AA88J2L1_FICCA|nr:hypothetical protein TIFTF001_029554 [Ficus carica]